MIFAAFPLSKSRQQFLTKKNANFPERADKKTEEAKAVIRSLGMIPGNLNASRRKNVLFNSD